MTIKDIARISGYSLGTVSRVLNGHPNVSEKARTQILSVVNKYHYQPNENAKLLKQQSLAPITIIVRGTQNMLFADIIEQLQALLLKKGEEPAIVRYLDEYDDEVASAVQFCKNRHPKGLIFLGGNLNHFQESFHKISVPCVLLTNNASSLDFPNLSSFTTNDEEASKHIIRYFIEHGHTHIGIVGGNPSSSQITHRRIHGATLCFQEYGLPFDLSLQYEPSRFSFKESYPATQRLLDRFPEVTAIYALSDVTAMSVIRAIVDRGMSVPDDISVIGYDGISLSRYTCPRLSTIYQSRTLLAQRGVEEILRMTEAVKNGEAYEPVHEVLPYHFLDGESVWDLKK